MCVRPYGELNAGVNPPFAKAAARLRVLTFRHSAHSEEFMKRLLASILRIALVSAAAWATVVAATPAQPVKLSAAAAATVLKEIDKDRTDTQKWLQSDPTSYLATIDRRDFEQKKTLTVGRAADNDVRIDDPAITAHHLKVTVDGDRFHVVAVDQDARFKVPADKEAKTWQDQRDATVYPSSIRIGRFL